MAKHKYKPRVPSPEQAVQFCDWMDGYCDGFDDFPDGAWQAACESAVSAYNKDHGTNYDPYDGWIFWLDHREQ